MERWLEIFDFPGYSVSDQGRVRNDFSDRVLTMFRNQSGVAHVSMQKDGVQHKRGIARLVAERFLEHTTMAEQPTPIHLDGNRSNNQATNLAWRPKWFADKYTNQWNVRGTRVPYPIVDVKAGTIYANSTEAAIANGILEHQIYESVTRGDKVYPTFQIFERA